MSKDRARHLLEHWIRKNCNDKCTLNLPIVDCVVYISTDEQGNRNDYTFIGLIKIAYDL